MSDLVTTYPVQSDGQGTGLLQTNPVTGDAFVPKPLELVTCFKVGGFTPCFLWGVTSAHRVIIARVSIFRCFNRHLFQCGEKGHYANRVSDCVTFNPLFMRFCLCDCTSHNRTFCARTKIVYKNHNKV